jgi:threonine/homoserine/homoserine lactone efflux protein
VSLAGSLAAGVVFGLALAAPPGPMNAVIAEESVVRGWAAGFRAGLGAATADAVFFVLALAGAVTFVREYPRIQAAMVGVGGLLMIYYAYGAASEVGATFRGVDAPGGADGDGDEGARGVVGTGFRKAFVLALSNPYQVVFWLAVGVGLLEPGRLDVLRRLPAVGPDLAGLFVVETGSPVLLVGLFVGIGVWIVGFPAALVGAERRVERVAPVVAAGSALVLAGFGVTFCWRAVATLL